MASASHPAEELPTMGSRLAQSGRYVSGPAVAGIGDLSGAREPGRLE